MCVRQEFTLIAVLRDIRPSFPILLLVTDNLGGKNNYISFTSMQKGDFRLFDLEHTNALSLLCGSLIASLKCIAPSSSMRLKERSRISNEQFCFKTSDKCLAPSRVILLLKEKNKNGHFSRPVTTIDIKEEEFPQ